MKDLVESRMKFIVDDAISIVKFDETTYFNKHFKKLQSSKGVDFLIYSPDTKDYFMLEVKNFRGHENEPNTKNRLKLENQDSVTLETALKVRDSLACMVGATRTIQDSELKEFSTILDSSSSIKVILLLEAPSVDGKGYKALTEDLKKKLAWFNVRVLVLNKKGFEQSIPWIHIENEKDKL